MFIGEEDVQATALRTRGWSISAIARHLGRDRKTVRDYLSGKRAPGERKRSEGAPFDTVARGYTLSYQSLTRSLRARRLRPRCEA